jgi:hypothetical protein
MYKFSFICHKLLSNWKVTADYPANFYTKALRDRGFARIKMAGYITRLNLLCTKTGVNTIL